MSGLNLIEGLEGLKSSLAQSAAQLWPKLALRGHIIPFFNFVKTGFLSHNFGSRYARKSTKGSKNADFSLDSKQD